MSLLDHRESLLWLEVSPPRGIAVESLISKLGALAGQIDAINLADNALGRIKLSGLVFASMLKARHHLPIVLNFSCRDRNRFALISDLLGAAALGIDGVVALQGDKLPQDGSGGARPVHDLTTFELLETIGALNRGDTGEGKRLLKTLPSLIMGAVANPNRTDLKREFELLRRKAEAGARFVITQPVFDRERAFRFAEEAGRLGLRVLIGILPIKRDTMAAYMKQNIQDLSGAARHFDDYTGMSEADARRTSIERNLALMDALASAVAGFNIMSGGGPSLAIELALEWRRHHGASSARP